MAWPTAALDLAIASDAYSNGCMPGLYGVEAETAEVARALQAQKTCEAEHGPPTTLSTER
jgi:hypothetical protein